LPLFMVLFDAARRAWRKHEAFTASEAVWFGAVFAVALLASWTNLWVFPEILQNIWRDDLYFRPGAGTFCAVSEPFAFPYGRFSSFVATTLPLSLGFFALFWLGAAYLGSGGVRLHAVFGGATLLSIILALVTTRVRLPHGFTGYILYFHLSAWCFIHELATGRRAARPVVRRIGSVVIALLLVVQLVHTLQYVSKMFDAFHRHSDLARTISSSRTLYVLFASPSRGSGDKERLRSLVASDQPRYIYVLSAYFANLAKYRHNADYRDDRAFYQALQRGALPYRLVERISLPFPFAFLSPDPEFRDTAFFLFKRRVQRLN